MHSGDLNIPNTDNGMCIRAINLIRMNNRIKLDMIISTESLIRNVKVKSDQYTNQIPYF